MLHLGDHDPSGIDMTRDNDARLGMFAREDVTVRRLALNFDQIETYGPPPNPAKLTDSRYETYFTRYGSESWELDALDPNVIQELIGAAVTEYRDEDAPAAFAGTYTTTATTHAEQGAFDTGGALPVIRTPGWYRGGFDSPRRP